MPAGTRSLRVVLFTVTAEAVPIVDALLATKGHRLVGVVTAPGPKIRRTDDYLAVARHARPGLDVIVSNYPHRWAGMIRPLRPDLIVCASFNWKLPADVLAVPPLGAINGHDALLPRYRGRNATGWALRNDEPAYGVTIHYMTPELDDGPILCQRRIPITDDDLNFASIWPRFVASHVDALDDALDRVVAGDAGVPQDESRVTHAGGAFEPEWRVIDWSRPAREVFVQVRSWYGARDVPLGAFGEIDGVTRLVTKTRLVEAPPSGFAPGTVVRRDGDGILVQCGDRPLLLLDAQPVAVEQREGLSAAAGG
ncbi:MAG TPA: formyltransferase family protein [Thermomicrobiaceae bacterium]|nr:formyltransferase family protein [Thermomicrobiaceae bacterium]